MPFNESITQFKLIEREMQLAETKLIKFLGTTGIALYNIRF